MFPCRSALPRLAMGFTLALSFAASAMAQSAADRLSDTIRRIEDDLHARVGVVVSDTGSNWAWTHRADERFPMNSTVKTVISAAILAQADRGGLTLDERLPVRQDDVLSYAPVTKARGGGEMAIGELCDAALDMSDNTAANLLVRRLGGPQAVTAFLRGIGDDVSRADRLEPELNNVAAGDPRDTTTPAAMVRDWRVLLLGDALAPSSRRQLSAWMSRGGVTGALLRAHAPENWQVADKSGAGERTRNIMAMVTPPGRAPWIVAIYLADADTDFAARDKAVKEIGAAVIEVLKSR